MRFKNYNSFLCFVSNDATEPKQENEKVQKVGVRTVRSLQRQGETVVAFPDEGESHLPPRVRVGAIARLADVVQPRS